MTTASAALPWRVPGFASAVQAAAGGGTSVPLAAPEDEVQLIRRRDPDAWRRLFDQEMPAIYRYARSRLGDPARAEDATSEVFEQAWKSADGLRDQGLPVRAWLFGIARNVVGSHRRWWVRGPAQVTIEAFDGAEEDRGLSGERLDLVRAIAALDAGHAEVINLRFVQGLSLQETAAVIGTSVDGVKGRQARALAALRERLGTA